jgi:hypothetical protein
VPCADHGAEFPPPQGKRPRDGIDFAFREAMSRCAALSDAEEIRSAVNFFLRLMQTHPFQKSLRRLALAAVTITSLVACAAKPSPPVVRGTPYNPPPAPYQQPAVQNALLAPAERTP